MKDATRISISAVKILEVDTNVILASSSILNINRLQDYLMTKVIHVSYRCIGQIKYLDEIMTHFILILAIM
jgi:hypothetical protein